MFLRSIFFQVRHRSCGIVGYPNVGKSLLFNCMVQTDMAASENYPFCTIDPNICKVSIPDNRVDTLTELHKSQRKVFPLLEIHDIAGLIKGASQGAGLGNAFLSHIRSVSGILHVVRCFKDPNVIHLDDSVNLDPIKEFESVEEELIISDLEVATKKVSALRRKAAGDSDLRTNELPMWERALAALENGKSARSALKADEK
eukprot:GHVL01006320.1.p4 GENE.GHVL01006320.1~~GHVL01006320.1.p4  ORF type:complete len:201 (-),score=27.08 GHVL01006320.1:3763-4365(-)